MKGGWKVNNPIAWRKLNGTPRDGIIHLIYYDKPREYNVAQKDKWEPMYKGVLIARELQFGLGMVFDWLEQRTPTKNGGKLTGLLSEDDRGNVSYLRRVFKQQAFDLREQTELNWATLHPLLRELVHERLINQPMCQAARARSEGAPIRRTLVKTIDEGLKTLAQSTPSVHSEYMTAAMDILHEFTKEGHLSSPESEELVDSFMFPDAGITIWASRVYDFTDRHFPGAINPLEPLRGDLQQPVGSNSRPSKRKAGESPAKEPAPVGFQIKRLRSANALSLRSAPEQEGPPNPTHLTSSEVMSGIAARCVNPWDTCLVTAGAVFAGEVAISQIHEQLVGGMAGVTEWTAEATFNGGRDAVSTCSFMKDMDRDVTNL
ncbi:hypothetical protein FRB90_000234 [Tulasnella sp. 427]|nr:hypothetical protein FRB90_000234 [Tulasnella sp. 427]